MAEEKTDLIQGVFVKFNDKHEAEKKMPNLIKQILDWDYSKPIAIKLLPYTNPRSLNQNALFHKWCEQMSKHFIEKVPNATKENMKLMMKQRFLGVEDVKIGKTVIEGQVKRTSHLDKGEMVYFMDNVYHWARDNGVLLDVPEYSEYQKLKNQQEV